MDEQNLQQFETEPGEPTADNSPTGIYTPVAMQEPQPEQEPQRPQREKKPKRDLRKLWRVLKIVKWVLVVLLTIALLIGGVLGHLTIVEYRPAYSEMPERGNYESGRSVPRGTVRILTMNTGYAGLDRDTDFFMDGGKSVNPDSAERVKHNMAGIEDVLLLKKPDVILLQEVDTDSKRTFGIDQWRQYEYDLGNYESRYAMNYSCEYVPYPLPTIGKVHSGLATYSLYDIDSATRYSLPTPFKWPLRIANLKRCLLVTRLPIEGKTEDSVKQELVIVNLHLEAYDDGEGKEAQTAMLLQLLQDEYAKGNYVIAGGDFNQSFPDGTDRYPIASGADWTPGTLGDLPAGWRYAWDSAAPTCRLLNQPYSAGSSGTQFYVIDGFILSPNVEPVSVRTQDAEFAVTDHNPVVLEARLVS